jgi:Ca2+-transporting ATPase
MSDWHQLDAAAAAGKLRTDVSRGLTATEAAQRLQQHGPNELTDVAGRSPGAIFLSQLTGTMVLLLIAAAVVSLAIGATKDAIAIGAIVILNAILGFVQEFRAERAMSALKALAVPSVRVRRDGAITEIPARELVPGDVMLLEAGNVVSADARVVESASLRTQEAALTGESDSVDKTVNALSLDQPAIGDRRNMVFMATSVTYGRGAALVTATGMNTELGRIAATLQQVRVETTPLQRRLDALGRTLAIAAVLIVGVIFGLGVLRGESVRLMFLTAVSMAVAAVPEGLPAVVTIALALGAQRMLKRRALIRKLSAVETLGSVTVICSDKTGTLTENRMRVTVLEVAGQSLAFDDRADVDLAVWAREGSRVHEANASASDSAMALLLAGGALCNDAAVRSAGSRGSQAGSNGTDVVGDPTEAAIVRAAVRSGLPKDDLDRRFSRVAEIPFDSDRKRMTTVHTLPGASVPLARLLRQTRLDGGEGEPVHVAFTKGAVDPLMEICTHVWTGVTLAPLDADWRGRIAAAHDRLAGEGMRLLGLAFRPLGSSLDLDRVEQDLVFVGVIAMVDPPRPEVRDSVATCIAAGIRPVMITGDHPLTARYVADRLGLLASGGRTMTGADLSRLTPEQLADAVHEVSVFARVSPEHKFAIVEALQRGNQIVAMTGDGVNDAPALKKADIGVAMGITGTDVSKEAAEAVLLDDNFATIVAAVEEGRVIYDNIRKFVQYLLTTNSCELLVMLVAPLVGMPLPLLPLQILWINLVTDGPTALTLGVEPPEPGVMQRQPRPPGESIFAGGLGRHVIWVGILMGALTTALGYRYWQRGDEAWQTVVFTTLAFSQMAHVLAIRSTRESLFRIGVLSNPMLAAAVGVTILLQLALLYVPWLRGVFSTVPLSAGDVAMCAAVAATIFVAVEIEKWLVRRRAASTGPRVPDPESPSPGSTRRSAP